MPMFDLLEPRHLMTVTFDAASGLLSVVGTENKDTIIFSEEVHHRTAAHPRLAVLRLHDNGQITDYRRGVVKMITIDAGAGADTVILGSINIPSRIDGGPGDDALSGGDVKDTINGQGGNDYIFGR